MRLNWNALSKYRSQIYALSILWVFVFHVFERFDKVIFKRVPSFIIANGNLGVDVFLFLSGIFMYYAIRKSESIRDFYKRRFSKILKIYLFFCVPYFFFYLLTGKMDPEVFIKQITFTREQVSSFWFLLCIMICYLVYPVLYKMIVNHRQKWILAGLAAYILLLVVLNYLRPGWFGYDEIMITRFPIFAVGCLLGPSVYEKREIRPGVLFVMLAGMIGKDVIKIVISHVSFLEYNETLVMRLYGGGNRCWNDFSGGNPRPVSGRYKTI